MAEAPGDATVLGRLAPGAVRVRFCPSPTGNLHVGNIRTALFNWAFARHYGGTFVFRVEDTDAARDSEESYAGVLDSLRWLGLLWDEGPEVGGPDEPYRQSERGDRYADAAQRLRDGGHAYDCYCTPEELEERRALARAEGRMSGYDGHCRALTPEQVAAFRAEGREPVLRFRMPDVDIAFDDLVRGEVTFAADQVPDYVIVRANGKPLYPLVNPVDDALMRITHVLRGEDLLSSTPRQIALHRALQDVGVSTGPTPRFGHLPFVLGHGGRKLSKRDPGGGLLTYRERGFLPEGLLNYLALLGWSLGGDREVFELTEMAEAFEIWRVNPNPAAFDLRKCEAINAAHLRLLADDELAYLVEPYLQTAGLLEAEPSTEHRATLAAAAPLVRERMTVLGEAVEMLGFLLVDEEHFTREPQAVASSLGDAARPVLKASLQALELLNAFAAAAVEKALRSALVDGLGLKPKHAFGPVRVAVTGRRVSPPLFESIELLGRERTLHRLHTALDVVPGG